MKNFIICIFCFVSFTCFAQNDLRFGAKVGVNLSGFTTSQGVDSDHTGISIGGIVDYRLSTIFALQSGLEYNQKGGIYQLIAPPYVSAAEVKLGYITVPVLAKLRIVRGLHVLAGPQLGFLVNEKFEMSGTELEGGDAKSFDIELLGGLAYEFSNGIMLQGSYGYGTSELYDNRPYKNSTLNFSVGYFFK